MKIEKYQCDKCKKVFDDRSGVLELRVQLMPAYPRVERTFHVCLPCGKKIGIEKTGDSEKDKSTADKLLDIVFDIVDEAIENR